MRVPMRENLALMHENNKGADQPAHSPSATRGGGGGSTLILSYIPRLGPFFGVQNFKFQYFGGFFQKNKYLGV